LTLGELPTSKEVGVRATVWSGQRERLGKWAFGQLRGFVQYKAKLVGIPVLFVDPRDTSSDVQGVGTSTSIAGLVSRSIDVVFVATS
jgi:hypothetical protein